MAASLPGVRVLEGARLLVASSHPGPTATVTVLAVVLAAAIGAGPGRIVVVALAVLAGQLSIGLANDWIDAPRDRAVGRTDKPVAQGRITEGAVRTAALVSAGVSVVLSFALGPAAGIAHTVLVGAGWAYDAGLKRTVFSLAPFVVAFGLLPGVVTLARTDPALPAWWATATGAVFGVAIHCTNVLPDLDDDAATGVLGLPHRLGRRITGVLAFGALVVAALLVLAGQFGVGAAGGATGGATGGSGAAGGSGADAVSGVRAVLAVLATVVTVVLAAIGTRLVLTRPPTRTLFRLVIVAALILVVELGASGTRLIA